MSAPEVQTGLTKTWFLQIKKWANRKTYLVVDF
jgi:hypothetical protein